MDRTRFITAGSFIDGSGAKVRRNVFLAIRDSIITAIGSADDLPRDDGAPIVHFPHCIIVPALVDCSVSLTRSPSVDGRMRSAVEDGAAQKAALAARHIRYCHSYGVLGVADSDDSIGLKKLLPKLMPEGSIVDIRTSGRLCRSREDCAAGPDFLKILYSGSVDCGDPSGPGLTREDLQHILQQRGNKKAVVVANGRQRVNEALAAGCDAIEQGYGMGEDNLRKMAEMGVLWIPGVLLAKNALDGAGSGGDVSCRFSMRYVAPGKAAPGAEAFWKKMLAEQLAQLRLAGKLGVKTALGTGAGRVGILHGESMLEEMRLFLKAGYSLEETCQCASHAGAGFFGMEDLGALTVGRKATFLVARGTVQQLPRKLSFLEAIYVNGAPSRTFFK